MSTEYENTLANMRKSDDTRQRPDPPSGEEQVQQVGMAVQKQERQEKDEDLAQQVQSGVSGLEKFQGFGEEDTMNTIDPDLKTMMEQVLAWTGDSPAPTVAGAINTQQRPITSAANSSKSVSSSKSKSGSGSFISSKSDSEELAWIEDEPNPASTDSLISDNRFVEEGGILDAEVSLAQNPDADIVASGFVVGQLDEEERERIRRDALRSTEAEFRFSVANAEEVKVVRIRSRRERIMLWACLLLTLFAIVLGVVIGVVFGVVMNGGAPLETDNDRCLGAEEVSYDLVIDGSTMDANVDKSAPNCSEIETNGAGVWYYLKGDGSFINASTCADVTDFDTQLSVFKGSNCSELECVVGNDNFCGNQSSVFWQTEDSSRYYILVHGTREEKGIFQLSITKGTRFGLLADEIEKEFQVQLNDPNSPQYQAALWLARNDTLIKVPIRTLEQRLEFKQRYALAVFYFSTGGRKWDNQLNFLSPESVCNWRKDDATDGPGVTCGEDKVVTELKIGFDSLDGTMPREMIGLSGIRRLNFSSCYKLRSTLPVISQLTTLESLWISNGPRFRSDLTGKNAEKIPSELQNLVALKSLTLSQYRVKGTIPPQLQMLTRLEELNLPKNLLTGFLPSTLFGLSMLTSLSLEENDRLGGAIPNEIGQLTLLQSLDLDACLFSKIPDELGSLPALEELYLRQALASSRSIRSIPASLGNLRQLRRLHLNENGLTGQIPEAFANLTALEELRLERNDLTGGAGALCGLNLDLFGTDCLGQRFPEREAELECPCCTYCCSDIQNTCIQGNGLPPENDNCEGALDVAVGSKVVSSTGGLAGIDGRETCAGVLNVGFGVWFRVTGTGRHIAAFTCGSSTTFDTRITIYQGDNCTSLTCISANKDGCGSHSSVTWPTEAGEEYKILVHDSGREEKSGVFELRLSDSS